MQEKPNILFIDVGCLPNAVQQLKVGCWHPLVACWGFKQLLPPDIF